jgi:hypothetical protein
VSGHNKKKKNSLDNVGGELYDKMSFLRGFQEKKIASLEEGRQYEHS